MRATSSRSISRLRWVHLVVGLFALLFAGSVQAHAMLVSSSITDGAHFDAFPTELVLTFSEEVGLVEGGTTLHGSNFEPIELSPTATDEVVTILLPEQGDGAYAVQWRVISADGHPISGTVRFTVGSDYLGESASVDQPLPDWFDFLSQMNTGLLYLGLLAASGVVITGWFVAPNATADICWVARRFMTMGLLAACVQLPLVAIAQRGEFFDSLNELMSGMRALDWSLMLLPVMLLAAIVLSRYRIAFLVPLLGALAMLLLTGHTRSRDPMWLMMLSDGVHISVGAIWLGGLIVLTLGLSGRWFRSAFATPNIPVARFSALAAWSVSALAITGGIMAWRILDSWDALFQTAYGQTLLIKVGVVLLVMVIAGVNRFWLLPRTSMAWLRKLVLAELVLLVVVTGVTGRLVNLDPNVQAATSAVLYQGQVDLGKGYLVELSVISDDGEITVTAQMRDDMDMVITPVESPVVAWSLDAQSLGPLNLELESTANVYEGAIILPVEGTWSMDFSVRVDRFTELHTSLQIQTNP